MRLVVLSFFLFLLNSAYAQEEPPEKAQARQLLAQGNALFERGDYRGALIDFRAAYALYPSPKLLVNAAAAEREMGDFAAAATDLKRFLDESVNDDATLVEKARNDLRALERRVAKIGLVGWPAKSVLEIDGRAVRDPTYVKPGDVTIHVRSPAGDTLDQRVTLNAGDAIDVPMPTTAPTAAPVAPTTAGETAPSSGKSKKGWIIFGVIAGVVVVGGIVGLAVALTHEGDPLRGDIGTFKFSDFR